MTEKADRSGAKSSAVSHFGDNMSGLSPKSDGDADFSQLFSRFEAFNFDSDPQFQAGLSRIVGNTNVGKAREHEVDFLKIKAFYYSRNVEPLDFTAYMDWRQKQGTGRDESQTPLTDHSCTKDKSEPDQPLTAHNQGLGPDSPSPYDAHMDSGSKKMDHEMSPSVDDKAEDSQCLSGAQNNDTSHVRESVDPHISYSQEISTEAAGVITINNMMSANSIAEDSGQGVNQPVKRVDHLDKKETVCSHVGTDHQSCDYSTEQQQTGEDTISTDHNFDADVLKQSRQTDLHIEKKSDSVCEPNNKEAPADVDGRQQELSFAEVAELIQSGKPIPGLATIEVVPTNVAPTPSRLHRVKKPWE